MASKESLDAGSAPIPEVFVGGVPVVGDGTVSEALGLSGSALPEDPSGWASSIPGQLGQGPYDLTPPGIF